MKKQPTRFRCVAQRGWYFLTREGRIGPFDTRREAEAMCQRYVHELTAKVVPLQRKRGRCLDSENVSALAGQNGAGVAAEGGSPPACRRRRTNWTQDEQRTSIAWLKEQVRGNI